MTADQLARLEGGEPAAEGGGIDGEEATQMVGRERREQPDLVEETGLRKRERRAEVAVGHEADPAGEQAIEAPQAADRVTHAASLTPSTIRVKRLSPEASRQMRPPRALYPRGFRVENALGSPFRRELERRVLVDALGLLTAPPRPGGDPRADLPRIRGRRRQLGVTAAVAGERAPAVHPRACTASGGLAVRRGPL